MISYFPGWDGKFFGGKYQLGPRRLTVTAGPCMLESLELGMEVGRFLREECAKNGFNYVFKASFDKANRTSKGSIRGPGLEKGLEWLETIGSTLGVPVLTDIHTPEQASQAAKVCEILQIPAFLCAHREILDAAAATGRVVEVKKGQHAAPEELIAVGKYLAKKGCERVILCDRGTSLGYGNLVADMRTLVEFREAGFACMFDATHSAQLPGAGAGQSLGLRHVVPALARAAVAVGIDALFLEVHPCPERALSDAATQLPFATVRQVLAQCAALASALALGVDQSFP